MNLWEKAYEISPLRSTVLKKDSSNTEQSRSALSLANAYVAKANTVKLNVTSMLEDQCLTNLMFSCLHAIFSSMLKVNPRYIENFTPFFIIVLNTVL